MIFTPLLVPILLILFLCFVFFNMHYNMVKEKEKQKNITDNLRQYAKRNNYKFHNIYPQNMLMLSEIFNEGYNIEVKNVVYKSEKNYDIIWGDHFYTTGHGRNMQIHQCSFVIIKCLYVSFPQFYMRDEEMIIDYLGKLLGGQDINFDGDDYFSHAFVLQGDSEKDIRRFFTRKIRSAFTSCLAKGGYRVCSNNHSFVIHQERQIDNIEARLELEKKAKRIIKTILYEHAQIDDDAR